MTDRTGRGAARPRRPHRKRAAAVATVLTTLLLGAVAQLSAGEAPAAETDVPRTWSAPAD
jgi:cellulose 1,4-beta-cellobiosidase